MHLDPLAFGGPLSTFSPRDGLLEVIDLDDRDAEGKRLGELGLCPGKRIAILRQGDPAIIGIDDDRFALAAALLARIFVRALNP